MQILAEWEKVYVSQQKFQKRTIVNANTFSYRILTLLFLALDSTTKHFLKTSVVVQLVYVYFCVQYSCSGMAYYVHTGVKFWSLFPLLHNSSYYAWMNKKKCQFAVKKHHFFMQKWPDYATLGLLQLGYYRNIQMYYKLQRCTIKNLSYINLNYSFTHFWNSVEL